MRSLSIAIFSILIAFSCRDKVICPAFQSTYILDDSTRIAYYSYAWKLDNETRQQYFASLPKSGDSSSMDDNPMMRYFTHVETIVSPAEQTRKSKYGIVKYEPYWLKNYKLRSAPMENVLAPKKPDLAPVDEGEFVASDFGLDSLRSDSTSFIVMDSISLGGSDSTAVALAGSDKKKETRYLYRYDPKDDFNVEQEYYNKYFGEMLIDNRPIVEEPEILPDSAASENKLKLFFSFQWLFNKESKSNLTDSTAVEVQTPVIEENQNPEATTTPEEEEGQQLPPDGGGGN